MRSFLLIHGGSHGAWCWADCIDALQAMGHQAEAIDLPGHGLDSTPRQTITTRFYVEAITKFIQKSEFDQCTIVGHSLAGIVLPEIAFTFPGKVEEVIFLAALVLGKNKCTMDYIPEERRSRYFEMAEASDDNSFLTNYEVARQVFFNDLPELNAKRCYDKLTPQPLAVYLEKPKIDVSQIACRKRYIACTNDNALGYEPCIEFARQLGGTVESIEAGHDVMLSRPKELAELLAAQY